MPIIGIHLIEFNWLFLVRPGSLDKLKSLRAPPVWGGAISSIHLHSYIYGYNQRVIPYNLHFPGICFLHDHIPP